MAFDNHANLAASTIATAPSPATSGTTLTVATGTGALFPTAPFNCTIWPTGAQATAANSEIIRVTSKGSGDNWTIQRTQESTSARAIIVGDQIANTISVKVITDIEGIASNASTAAAAAISAVNLSAGATSANLSAVTFSNSNGVSFGLTNSIVTASVQTNYQTPGAYLTTAMASNAATISNAKFSAGTLSDLRSDITFSDSNGVSFGLNTNGSLTATVKTDYQTSGAYLTTAMQSNAATISNVKVSAGTLSNNLSAVTFGDSNGVSWGLNTNSVLTATVKTDYQTSGAYLTTAMQSNAATISNIKVSAGASSSNVSALTFSNANGVTFGYDGTNVSASVATNYLTTAALSSQTLAISLSGNTATTNSSQIFNGGYALAGGNNVTLQQSNNTVSISVGNYITTADLS